MKLIATSRNAITAAWINVLNFGSSALMKFMAEEFLGLYADRSEGIRMNDIKLCGRHEGAGPIDETECAKGIAMESPELHPGPSPEERGAKRKERSLRGLGMDSPVTRAFGAAFAQKTRSIIAELEHRLTVGDGAGGTARVIHRAAELRDRLYPHPLIILISSDLCELEG